MFPVSAPPIKHGAVLIDDRGKIVAVGPDSSVPKPGGTPEVDFPNAALIPGLINVHTHLELTDLGGPIETSNFYEWIQTIRREVAARSHDMLAESARRGVFDAWRCGTTTVADTGSTGVVAPALADMFGRGVVYQEVFGPNPDDADVRLEELQRTLERLYDCTSERVTIGVSPHAPYTVSGKLYRAVADFARCEGIPVATHIAESVAESDLIVSGGGEFSNALTQRGVALPQTSNSPIQYIRDTGLLDTELLAIHCVQVDVADCALLAAHNCAVASCPTSNRLHGHGVVPLEVMVNADIRVGVGTDSVASVGSLDLFREGHAVRQWLNLSAEETLRFLTMGAACVLNMEQYVGSLEVGKWGDLAVVALHPSKGSAIEQIVAASPSQIRATFVAGRRVYDAVQDSQRVTRGYE